MAQRRMFSKTITNSGKFLKMPASSRLLYYDLGMNADDDGYAEWFTVVRMTGSAEQDLQVLVANGLVKVFDENVLVVLDWKENNYIPKDRYTPSKYLGTHRLDPSALPTQSTPGIQSVYKMDTQVRLGKDRIEYLPVSDETEFYLNFPFPVIEGIHEQSSVDSDGNEDVGLYRGQTRLKKSEVSSLLREYKSSQQKAKPQSKSFQEVDAFAESFVTCCDEWLGVHPVINKESKIIIASAIKRRGYAQLAKIAMWYLRSQAKDSDKLNIKNVVSDWVANKYIAETKDQI